MSGRYFPFEQVNPELRALAPGIDQPAKVVEWRKHRYVLAWHTRFGVYIARIKVMAKPS